MEVQVKQSLLRKFAIQSERDRRGGSPFLVRKGCSRQLSVNTWRQVAVNARRSDLQAWSTDGDGHSLNPYLENRGP